jgi:hypothetical protein
MSTVFKDIFSGEQSKNRVYDPSRKEADVDLVFYPFVQTNRLSYLHG